MAGGQPFLTLGRMLSHPAHWLALALGAAVLGAWPSTAAPAVARPKTPHLARPAASGTAFFLRASEDEVVAVTTAHNIDLPRLGQGGEVQFVLGKSGSLVSASTRLFSKPGRPFSEAGATLAEDYLIFALDSSPRGVEILEADVEPAASLIDERVRILGVPATRPKDQDDLYGTVREVENGRLEVELDVPADLRGWGGAPVLRHPEGSVVGILQALWPEGDSLRLGVGPISGVLAAISAPAEGRLGLPLTSFAPKDDGPAGAEQPGPLSDQLAVAHTPREIPGEGPLLGRAGVLSTQIRLEIEEPADGTVVGEASGAFIAGRALALLGEFRRFDVILVLDTSGSTSEASGADINDNGIVGKQRFGILNSTDPGDSVLAAEIAAARQVIRGLDPRNTRVGIITFAGQSEDIRDPYGRGGTIVLGRSPGVAALTEEALTSDFARVEKALGHVLERGPDGGTNMGAGLRQAIRELKGFRGGLSIPDPDSEKVVLFFTDGEPTAPYDPADIRSNTRSVLRAAEAAARAQVRIHSFAIGTKALKRPIAAVEMASRTGGYFTPVREPGDLKEVIESVSCANIEAIEVTNLTTGEAATELHIQADGGYGALVPVRTGLNRIRVLARASDGSETTAEVSVGYAKGVKPIRLPRELVALRNQLLQERLMTLKRGSIAAERKAAERTRKELLLEIREERARAQERAAQQTKDLQLEVEPIEPLER
ncbi:MAG: VWA domain-containing protein [bacterium]|nr:VWA domain-containing protein [bacterium]